MLVNRSVPSYPKIPRPDCLLLRGVAAHPRESWLLRRENGVIPNGFDLEKIKPDPDARASVRQELGIPLDAPLIGIAARFHPQKDHRNFVRAAARLHKQNVHIHFLLCGLDITWQNSQLSGWIETAGIRDCCHLLGVRQDMTRLFAGWILPPLLLSAVKPFPW